MREPLTTTPAPLCDHPHATRSRNLVRDAGRFRGGTAFFCAERNDRTRYSCLVVATLPPVFTAAGGSSSPDKRTQSFDEVPSQPLPSPEASGRQGIGFMTIS